MQTVAPCHAHRHTPWSQAMALAFGLIATTAQAQVANSFSVTLQRGTQSQVLQDIDYASFERSVANLGSNEAIDLPAVVLDRTIVRTDTSTISDAENGTQQVLQLVRETVRYTTQFELYSRLDESYDWTDGYDSLPDTAPVVTGVTFEINTDNPRDRLEFSLKGQLLANEQGQFDFDQGFASLVIDGQPDASFINYVFIDQTGEWFASLSLIGNTAGRTFSFQASSNSHIHSLGFRMISRLGPVTPLEIVETRTIQRFELVAWNPTSPVPEPSSWAMGALGLGWMLARALRRRAAARAMPPQAVKTKTAGPATSH